MNELPRLKLSEIVARHGQEVVRDGRRLEGLLRDYCGEYRREVSVLVMALEEHVPKDMLAAPTATPREVLLARLAQRLCDNLALSEAAAGWAVNSWALALGLISVDELKAIEQRASARAQAAAGANVVNTPPAQSAPSTEVAAVLVSADGRGDYESINAALKATAPGARLLVRPGVYNESVRLDRQVEIVGDGPREKIIVRADDSSCLLMDTYRARVAGLTLRGAAPFFAVDIPRGRLLLEDCDLSSDTLSCVGVHGREAAPLIRGCRIHNAADSGLYFFDGAAGVVEGCEVSGSANVGVAVTGRASPAVRRSKIYGGADAGIVVWKEGDCLVEGCEIYGNRRAGLGVSEGGRATVRSCRIYKGDNSGVFVHDGGDATLEGCDIFGHREAEVAVETEGRLRALRCQIHDGLDSGVFVRRGGQALIQECDIRGNGGAGIKVAEGGAASVSGSDLSANRLGAWDVEDGAHLEGEGNREE